MQTPQIMCPKAFGGCHASSSSIDGQAMRPLKNNYFLMNKLNKIQQFQLFCLESYRLTNNISGIKALNEFREFKVLDYLAAGYDVLHTQSENYIISDINDYLKRRK